MAISCKGITTVNHLREHLQAAVELEHATIPAYLTALYSIKEGTNDEAALIIRSVVIEEMLHMTLAANVLNAVGGQPAIDQPDFIPEYPTTLPYIANGPEVGLIRFSPRAMVTFKAIEHPRHRLEPESKLHSDSGPSNAPKQDNCGCFYGSIGEFYQAILEGIDTLCSDPAIGEDSVFTGQLARQITPEHYYGSGGSIVVVTDRKTARNALDLIVEQGEGANDGRSLWEEIDTKCLGPRDQAAHYYRFDEIYRETYYKLGDSKKKPIRPSGKKMHVDWRAVWPLNPNSKAADFEPGSDAREALEEFNRFYSRFLRELHSAFNGQPGLFVDAIPRMYKLKYMAQALCCIPMPHGPETLGPSWEWTPD